MGKCSECEKDCDVIYDYFGEKQDICLECVKQRLKNDAINAKEEDRATSRQLAFERAAFSGNVRDLINALRAP